MANYALDAIQGYAALKNIHRQEKNDERRDQMLQLSLDDRNRALDREKAQMDLVATRNKSLLPEESQPIELKQPAQPKAEPYKLVADSWQSVLSEKFGVPPGSKEAMAATAKMQPFLENPESAAEALAVGDRIENNMKQGKLPSAKDFTSYLNLVGASELNARNKDGNQMKVNSVVPSPNGQGVMLDFTVTRPDGSTYIAPATRGKSSAPDDTEVQEFAVKDIIQWFAGSRESLKALLEAETRAGVTTTADAYQKYKERQMGRTEGIEDALAIHKAKTSVEPYAYDGQNIITRAEYDKMADKGNFTPLAVIEQRQKSESHDARLAQSQAAIAASNASTKSRAATAGLKGKWVEGPDGWQFISQGETAQAKKKITTKEIGEGRIMMTDDQGDFVIIKPDEELEMIAMDQAKNETEGKGLFNRQSEEDVKANAEIIFNQLKAQQEQSKAVFQGKEPAQQASQQQEVDAPKQQETPKTAASFLDNFLGPKQEKEVAEKPPEKKETPEPAYKKVNMQSELVSTAGLSDIAEIAKKVPGLVKDVGNEAISQAKTAKDIYMQLLGKPAEQMAEAAKKELSKNLLTARLRNGVITQEEYEKAISLLDN